MPQSKNQILCEVVFTEEPLVRFKQEWMNAKTKGVECEVLFEIQGTHLEVVINGEGYTADIAELANTLINKVMTPKTHKELTQQAIDINSVYMGGIDDVAGD